MPKPLRLLIDFLSYEGTPTNDPQDAIAMKRKVEETDVEEVIRLQTQIPATTTDQAITLPDANTDYLIICVDQQVSIKVNGSATAMTLNPKSAGKKTPVFMWRGDITALTITNAGSNPANIDLIAANI